MIKPEEVKEAAKKMEENNYEFRLFLKEHADQKTLDQQFHDLHRELFAQMDCNTCMNCCKKLTPTFHESELDPIAREAGMETSELMAMCDHTDYEEYQLQSDVKACPFLTEAGCQVQACKPKTCREFPYTDQEDRLGSLLGMVSFIRICPVVYEMFERLKVIYGFQNPTENSK